MNGSMMSSSIDLIVVGLFMLMMLGTGVWLSLRTSSEDYVVAGRKMSWPVIGFHGMATYIGVGTLMGALGAAYFSGISGALYPISLTLSFFVMAIIAPRLRMLRPVTIGDILTKRYSNVLRLPNALAVSSAMIGSSSAQMIAFGALAHVLLGVDKTTGIIIFSLVVIIYTVLGGMIAAAYTDVIQGSLMLITIGFIALPISIYKSGGLGAIFSSMPDNYFDITVAGWPNIVSYILIYGLLLSFYTSDGQMMIYSSRDIHHARKGSLFGVCLMIPFVVICVVIAFAAQLLVPGIEVSAEVFPRFCIEVLPVGVVGMAIGGVLAAGMSTSNTSLVVAAVTLVKDFIDPLFRKNRVEATTKEEDKKEKVLNQVVAFAVGIFSVALALSGSSIIDVINLGWDIAACIISVPMIAALYWARATTPGAVAAMIAGFLSWVYVYFFSPNAIAAYLAVPISAAVMIIVSLLTKPENHKKILDFYADFGFVIGLQQIKDTHKEEV